MTYKGTQRLGDFFSSRREKGIAGISTLSITIDNGVVERNSIDRKMETNLSADEHLLGKSGDIAYNMMRMWQGASGLIEKDGLLSPAYIVLAPKQGIDSKYAAYLFKSPRLIYLFWAYSYGLTNDRLRLYFNDFIKIPVEIPSLPEQTKIANFLTAIDEKISQLTQKCDLLAQYKKSVMQQIFSQQIRFKDDDGREFPEWEEEKLGDIFTFIQTNSFSRELLNYEDGSVKNIHYGDIHIKFKSYFKIESENVPFINPAVDLSKVPEDCYCKEGDLVIADASEDYADVGKTVEIISLQNQKLLSGLHTYIARDLSKQMSLGFSGYLMQTESVRLQIKTLATGVSVLGISKRNLAKVKLKVPSRTEQTKIANFLTAIDDKIIYTQAQLAAMKQYKQGLLQQMFV